MSRCATLVIIGIFFVLASLPATAQEVIDRIAGRVEGDIVLLSEVRALGRYQVLVDGKSESDAQILDRLIDQWIVRNEAEAAHFPRPTDSSISRGVDRLTASFASPSEYDQRKKQAGLTDDAVRKMVSTQLYLSNYLDSRFRPGVQIEPKDVDDFYHNAVIPRAKARNQAPPSLQASREYIQEALVQRSIDEQADRWLKESRLRLHIEKFLPGEVK